ncbi:MAG TPA: hypothetical protein VFZ65_10290 [Planctomycetota bacterium]|nr:hypothetical protein [Planctomycetota bacterium]
MSTFSLARGPRGTLGAWETEGQIRFAELDGEHALRSAPGRTGQRKHPSIACNRRGEVLLAWTERMGWNKGGSLAWQLFDDHGEPVNGEHGECAGVPVWGLVQAVALPDERFAIVY